MQIKNQNLFNAPSTGALPGKNVFLLCNVLQSFPWFRYFNVKINGKSLCLGGSDLICYVKSHKVALEISTRSVT